MARFCSQKADRQANMDRNCDLYHNLSAGQIQATRRQIACGNSANKVLKIGHAAILSAAELIQCRQRFSGPVRFALC